MNIKKITIIFFIFLLTTSCQTIKEKSDAVVEKENQEYGKFVGKNINKLKIELGNPTEDFRNELGNKILLYKTKKYGIPCERRFEINSNLIVIGFVSNGCF